MHSFYLAISFFLSVRNNKTRSMAGSGKVHALGSPRDTALRSIPKLKQFMRKKSSYFLSK
ncbi:hypothetical protein GRY00_003916 [Salmonella enterica]|nr:hypothetical protein [Salmonella enterica]EBO2603179.1 hypothetical protein [Salmonella enterica subsp. enterica serovar Agona]EBW0640207.1 hypothetical protein [Salmonella enterica subsp. arizonae serovar 18:z4,z23:-]ECG0634585.1 hypothetical protein [Salmonella enterica subsp. enterica]EDR6029603.1 hypothetical protein [Salmonella enterica subsp. enterica serovar 4,[5],12:i:-]EFA3610674.1 hypothetical protein [Escherichia coli]MZF77816.1 hypothetical protein [Salmonella enterica subsp. e